MAVPRLADDRLPRRSDVDRIERDDAAELEDCRWFEREEVQLMFAGAHPDGLKAPFPMAIAHRIIGAWVETQ